MHLWQCLPPTKCSINVSSHYLQLIRKLKHWNLFKVSSLVSVWAEASPGRHSNSRAGALKHGSILLPQQKRNHNELICGLVNDSLFCPRLSARGLWNPVEVLKHICRFFGAPLIKRWSLSPPVQPEWTFVTVLISETRLEKKIQIPFGWITWDTDLWSLELPWKMFGYAEATMLEKPRGETM